MKCIKVGNSATILLSDGTMMMLSPFTEEDMAFISNNPTEEDIKLKFLVEFKDYFSAVKKVESVMEKVAKVNYLKFEENKVIIPSISNVSVPENLVDKITLAQDNSDENSLQGYLNFWRLLCQNPNAEARDNLLWFLEKYNFSILRSGLFVAYRSVVTVTNPYYYEYNKILGWKKSPKKYSVVKTVNGMKTVKSSKVKMGNVIGNLYDLYHEYDKKRAFTDKHTKSFKIRLGEPVKMDRTQCNEDSSITCSNGLHLATKDWDALESFGDTIIMCLCNPEHVVAVPTRSDYGKLRTCEYFPVKIYTRGEESIPNGTELDYFEVAYDKVIHEKNPDTFKLEVPEKPMSRTQDDLNIEEIIKQLREKTI